MSPIAIILIAGCLYSKYISMFVAYLFFIHPMFSKDNN